MLTGSELGAAIEKAITLKKVTKAQVARDFGVKPPSITDWIKRGTIEKSKLDQLFSYFSSVVGPEHWGITRRSAHRWAAEHVVEKPSPSTQRPLVATLSALAEQISDDGLRELIGFARCLTGTHPLAQAKRRSSA